MRPRARFTLIVAMAAMLLLALAGPASAHEMTVRSPRTGAVVHVQWIGGDTVPSPAEAAPPMFGPFSLPPSHGSGLPHACMGTMHSPAVTITAPPFFSGCHHGQP